MSVIFYALNKQFDPGEEVFEAFRERPFADDIQLSSLSHKGESWDES